MYKFEEVFTHPMLIIQTLIAMVLYFQEHTYLVHRRKHGNYLVFHCLNCGLNTYAMHINGNPIIASGEVQVKSS